jgi:predicted site-specific integrase-resolvase
LPILRKAKEKIGNLAIGLNKNEVCYQTTGRSNAGTDKEDLMQDFVSLVTSMVARLYGLRRSKRKTEQLIRELQDDQKINDKS